MTTPLILCLFNRPQQAAGLIEGLRVHRPPRILVIADGPRQDHPEDCARCQLSLDSLLRIDWPCAITENVSARNLGCDLRLTSGLDWAFGLVEEAIVLEDDTHPDPSLFPWAEAMLRRWGNDPGVGMICGRNALVRWGRPGASHLRCRRGNLWGWAARSSAWHATRKVDLAGDPDAAPADLAAAVPDPLLVSFYAPVLAAIRAGTPCAWDVTHILRHLLSGRHALVAPTNLVRNTGIGAEASRMTHTADFNAALPVGAAPPQFATEDSAADGPEELDAQFDHLALLAQLLSRCVDPQAALKLARFTLPGVGNAPASRFQQHLEPFRRPAQSLALLEHLRACGVVSPHLEALLEALTPVATIRSGPAPA
ncbi:hypothetical protein KBY97_10425 [Synechococcus sp. ATX 2A4]|uniref:hypothetical protein n=1 Tax=Synechococcus sp. ATX 2A4 TaxID=2823727 RepID=UPI0020CB9AA0|nr:hypothetical protein [Synechococcus sp. ATX 2A4]MCP9885534.1 hypothetical protein [Synechococcus sp. ATX 2A4]